MPESADFSVTTSGAINRVHLSALKLASRTGHIRRAAKALARVRRNPGSALVGFPDGGILEIDLRSSYWARLAVGWDYEPEVRVVVDSALAFRPDLALLDCGSNIGYWGARYARRCLVVAVEPVPTIYTSLQRTAQGNGFIALHRAVWSRSDEAVEITWNPGGETAASAVYTHAGARARVSTITIDELAETAHGRPLVVKLDVEGAEAQAVDGAERTGREALWIYEDHGMDREHAATARFLASGFQVLDITSTGRATQISSLDQLSGIKTNRKLGYNFAAFHAAGPWAGFGRTLVDARQS
ncbi:MAG: FkbM family methyltransferase [Actinomycetes bacterium]